MGIIHLIRDSPITGCRSYDTIIIKAGIIYYTSYVQMGNRIIIDYKYIMYNRNNAWVYTTKIQYHHENAKFL